MKKIISVTLSETWFTSWRVFSKENPDINVSVVPVIIFLTMDMNVTNWHGLRIRITNDRRVRK